LKKKLDRIPLDSIFDDFDEVIDEGKKEGQEVLSNKRDQSVYYMKQLFIKRYRGKGNVFTFETNATDEKACDKVFRSIREDIILKKIDGLI